MDNQVQQHPQPVQQQPFAFKRMPLRINKTIIISIVVLTIISLGSTTYMLVSPKQKKNLSSNELVNETIIMPSAAPEDNTSVSNLDTPAKITSTPTITPAPTTDPTNNWNTYTNSNYKYSIKYPLDWTVKNLGQLEPKVPSFVVFNPKDATETAKMITISYSTRTYDEAMAIGATNSEIIKVGTISAAKKTEQDSNRNELIHIIIPLKNNTNTLIFYAKSAYKTIFDQMLPTLKFL